MKINTLTLIGLVSSGILLGGNPGTAAAAPLKCTTKALLYSGSQFEECPAGMQVVAATCNGGNAALMNDTSTPLAAGTWTSYLWPDDTNPIGARCSLAQGASTMMLRCCSDTSADAPPPPPTTPFTATINYLSSPASFSKTYGASWTTSPGTSITSYRWEITSGYARITSASNLPQVTLTHDVGCSTGRQIFHYSTLKLTLNNSINQTASYSTTASFGTRLCQ